MKWKFKGADKETNHRFLNFYTVHYEVTKDDGSLKEYSYFVASRNLSEDELRINRKEFNRPDAVLIGCYMMKEDGIYLLLEKQFRPALNAEVISFPAGLIDKEDKTVEETARREAKEETGYELSDIEVLLPPSPTSEGLSDECNSVVIARLLEKGHSHKEEFEDIKAKLYSRHEVMELLEDQNNIFSNSARLLILYLLERFK